MKPRGRESLKDRIRRNAAAFEALRPPGVEVAPIYRTEPETVRAARVKVSVTSKFNPLADKLNAPVGKHAKDVPLESTVLKDIIGYLRGRSDIGAIVRTNSGQAREEDHGKARFISFNHVYGKNENGELMRVLDIQCIQRTSGKLIAIECKRPGFKRPMRSHEFMQEAYIKHIRTCGGIAFFATCIADVERGLSND